MMYRLEFGIAHRGCIVNQLSNAIPQVRFICPGGFILGGGYADEVITLDQPSDEDVAAVMAWFGESPAIEELELLERTSDKATIAILANAEPPQGYCSQAVERNRCFRIGYEIQQGGVEQWVVGAKKLEYAEGLVEDLKGMGDLKYARISESSWLDLVDAVSS